MLRPDPATLLRAAAVILAGVSLGMMSAHRLMGDDHGLFARHSGAWVTWPEAAGPGSDPYSRGHFLSEGRLPVTGLDRLEYATTRDSAGRALDGECDYQLTGPAPAARDWVLSVLPARPAHAASGFAELRAASTVFEPDGSLTIIISAEPQPGNWLQVPRKPLQLRLTLDTPTSALRADPAAASLPDIVRRECH